MASYWDIDDYLAGEEQVQVKSLPPSLSSFLCSPNDDPSNSIQKIPLHLAQALESRSLCTTISPPYLSESFQSTLLTAPNLLNLSSLNPNFYLFSAYFACKDPGLPKILCSLLLNRLKKVFNQVGIGHLDNEILKMTCLEVKIGKLLIKTDVELKDWIDRKHEKVVHNFQVVKGG